MAIVQSHGDQNPMKRYWAEHGISLDTECPQVSDVWFYTLRLVRLRGLPAQPPVAFSTLSFHIASFHSPLYTIGMVIRRLVSSSCWYIRSTPLFVGIRTPAGFMKREDTLMARQKGISQILMKTGQVG